MNKLLLLAHAHFRKNRGTSIGLLCLLVITAMLLGLSILMLTDAYPLASTEAERLDSGDGFFRITEDMTGLDEDVLDDILKDDTNRHYSYSCLNYIMSVPFAGGDMSCNFQFCNEETAYGKELGRSEVVTEDPSITSAYAVLPYQFYTSGGYKIGDDFNIEVQGIKYDLKVRGFLTTPYFGCNNSGSYEIVGDDDTYSEMVSVESSSLCYIVIYELKDGVKDSAFGIRFVNDCIAQAPSCAVSHFEQDIRISYLCYSFYVSNSYPYAGRSYDAYQFDLELYQREYEDYRSFEGYRLYEQRYQVLASYPVFAAGCCRIFGRDNDRLYLDARFFQDRRGTDGNSLQGIRCSSSNVDDHPWSCLVYCTCNRSCRA